MFEKVNSFPLRVYYEDTDAGGIVYFANYQKFFERARTEWLRELGINQSYYLEQNLGFVVRKVEMEYLASAKLDDLLNVVTEISDLKRASVVFKQYLYNENEQLLCQADVLVVFVNLERAKPCAIPDELLGALKRVS
ncbi:tol-pal system-associated acyl-CoA thioesterase [Thalassotalea fusca]|mgnify:FL=1